MTPKGGPHVRTLGPKFSRAASEHPVNGESQADPPFPCYVPNRSAGCPHQPLAEDRAGHARARQFCTSHNARRLGTCGPGLSPGQTPVSCRAVSVSPNHTPPSVPGHFTDDGQITGFNRHLTAPGTSSPPTFTMEYVLPLAVRGRSHDTGTWTCDTLPTSERKRSVFTLSLATRLRGDLEPNRHGPPPFTNTEVTS